MNIHIIKFIVFLSIFASTTTHAQTPNISWQQTIGGSDIDFAFNGLVLPNNNVIICAYSKSGISGEKTSPSYGDEDFWILEFAADSSIVWQTTIGGSGLDRATNIIQTNDGGYLVVGGSNSPISGNKTDTLFGQFDIMLVKLSNTGAIEWQKTYGGDQNDGATQVILNGNNGYFIAGSSSSGVNGNKTTPSKGDGDYWIIQTDLLGEINNQFGIGGSGSDNLTSIVIKSNGNFILGGSSTSDISGDKAQNSYGYFDFWIMECDNQFNILQSNTLGGDAGDFCSGLNLNALGQPILFGYSRSGVSGNKSTQNYGFDDYWVVKLNHQLQPIWDVSFGGEESDGDVLCDGLILTNGSIIIGGSSYSNVSGNKSSSSFGNSDIWLVGIDSSGQKIFDFSTGGTGFEYFGNLYQDPANNVFIWGGSSSSQSGNKLQGNRGETDIWFFQLDFTVSIESIPTFDMQVYPNPTSQYLHFSIPTGLKEANVNLMSSSGVFVLPNISKNATGITVVDVSDLKTGIYFLRISGSGYSYTHKVIIN